MRRTKIVCTLGPASSSPEMITRLIGAGMDVARVNMSHGDHAGHATVIRRLREASRKLGKPLAILLDLQGPKIRTGKIAGGKLQLKSGERVVLTTRPVEGTAAVIPHSYGHLPQDVSVGDPILIDDGKLRLKVLAVKGKDVSCEVMVGGWLSNHKGINLPGVPLSTPSVTAKDMKDLAFGLQHGVDYVALSFVRRPEDVLRVKKAIAARGLDTPVIAKIEKPEALEHLRAIMRVTDGVMVARGDLGVELEPEMVPLIQKELISLANHSKVLVITATQMLESMTEVPSPTRAEASDVANAIFDGTDAVMLSGETAAGKYPIEAASMMARICEAAENSAPYRDGNSFSKLRAGVQGAKRVTDAVAYAARAASEDLRVKAMICFTQSGSTARLISKYRPEIPVYAFSPSRASMQQLGLVWGTSAMLAPKASNSDRLFKMSCDQLKRKKLLSRGDNVIIISGTPLGESGSINMMKIHKVD
jgi:pyruvate kinase